jgi:hypothetical protein
MTPPRVSGIEADASINVVAIRSHSLLRGSGHTRASLTVAPQLNRRPTWAFLGPGQVRTLRAPVPEGGGVHPGPLRRDVSEDSNGPVLLPGKCPKRVQLCGARGRQREAQSRYRPLTRSNGQSDYLLNWSGRRDSNSRSSAEQDESDLRPARFVRPPSHTGSPRAGPAPRRDTLSLQADDGGSARPHGASLKGGYLSVTSRKEYAMTLCSHRTTPSTKSNMARG